MDKKIQIKFTIGLFVLIGILGICFTFVEADEEENTLQIPNNFTIIYNDVWVTGATEIIRIEIYDKEGNLVDTTNINVTYDSDYMEDENITRHNIGAYQKEFGVKDKLGKTNITFNIDDIQKEIEIIIEPADISDRMDRFFDKGNKKLQSFFETLNNHLEDFFEKYGVVTLAFFILFLLLILVVAAFSLIHTLKKKK